MRILRRPAVQGHAIPHTAHAASGPFPDELFRAPVIEDVEPDDPSPWATAQNNYQEPTWYRCSHCKEFLSQDEVDAHRCSDGT